MRLNDEKIRLIVNDFKIGMLGDESPDQMCFTVCYPLSEHLKNRGIENSITGGLLRLPTLGQGKSPNHYWLNLNDGTNRVVDPTAGQFPKPNGDPMPSIYIASVRPEWYEEIKIDLNRSFSGWIEQLSKPEEHSNLFFSIKAGIILIKDLQDPRIHPDRKELIRKYIRLLYAACKGLRKDINELVTFIS